MICAIAFSPDGRLAATGCDDGKVRLWDTATGRPVGPVLRPGKARDSGDRVRWGSRPTAGSSASDRLPAARRSGMRPPAGGLGLPAEAAGAATPSSRPMGVACSCSTRTAMVRTWDMRHRTTRRARHRVRTAQMGPALARRPAHRDRGPRMRAAGSGMRPPAGRRHVPAGRRRFTMGRRSSPTVGWCSSYRTGHTAQDLGRSADRPSAGPLRHRRRIDVERRSRPTAD